MGPGGFERLLVCLPARASIEGLLESVARFAAVLPARAIDVVAAPAHELHGARRGVVSSLLGRRPATIHVVPSPEATVDFAASIADGRSLIVTSAADARRLPRRLRSAALVLPASGQGRTVIAAVDPARDTPAVVAIGLDLAARLSAPKLIACYPWFEDVTVACDDWEARAVEAREEQMAIFLSRVPASEVPLEPRVVFTPSPERALSRLADQEEAALIVSPVRLAVQTPVLVLPDSVARRPRPASAAEQLWRSFLDGPIPA